MISLSYTKSGTLLDTLSRIDALRTKILTTPLPIQTEHLFLYQSSIQAIYHTLRLSQIPIAKEEIILTLSAQKKSKSPTGISILSCHNAFLWITQHWSGNGKQLTRGDLQVLFTILHPKPSQNNRFFAQYGHEIDKLLVFLSNQSEHPVIRAGLMHAYFLSHPVSNGNKGMFAHIAHTLILSQYGYTLRGMATNVINALEYKTYLFAQETITKYGQYTQWLEYMAISVESAYKQLLSLLTKEIRSFTSTQDMVDRTRLLTKREEEILALFLNPSSKITNRQIQQHFHISPITASRNLKNLTNYGLLYAHGKGRSVYYTKV